HLLAALTHVAGEHTTTTPPNPNEEQFVKSGLKPVLQTVYQLASDIKDPIQEAHEELAAGSITTATGGQSTQTILSKALDHSICGFVVMNNDRKIIYASKATPIRVDTEGVQSLDLL